MLAKTLELLICSFARTEIHSYLGVQGAKPPAGARGVLAHPLPPGGPQARKKIMSRCWTRTVDGHIVVNYNPKKHIESKVVPAIKREREPSPLQKATRVEVEEQPSEEASPGEIVTELFPRGSKKRNHKRRTIVLIVAILLNAGLLAFLGSELLTPAQNQSHSGSKQSSSSPLVGHPAPDFTLAMLSANPRPAIHLASLQGKPVMLNFWASWCDPCKQEAQLLESTWRRVQSRGIVLIGIDFEDGQSAGLGFLHTYGITYPTVIDASGSVAINYGVTGVPETFFIDRHGIITSKVIGQLTAQTVQSNLRSIAC